MSDLTVKRFPEYGWAVMDRGVKIGTERGPWWPTRKAALAAAKERQAARERNCVREVSGE